LSPILFSYYLHVNDLQDFLSSKNNEGIKIENLADNMIKYLRILVLLYADDTIILAKTADDFQKCLNDFSEFCKIWKLNININKTKVMIFGSSRRSWRNHKFTVNENVLEIVDSYKYLGDVFCHTGNLIKPLSIWLYKHEKLCIYYTVESLIFIYLYTSNLNSSIILFYPC